MTDELADDEWTMDEVNERLAPFAGQREALEEAIPLAVYAPASQARLRAELDAVIRLCNRVLAKYFRSA